MAQLAEAQARLNVNLRDIVTFFEEASIQEHSIDLLNSFIDKHLTMDFLSLAEGFGKCMAFINHDDLSAKLLKSYMTLIDGYIIERKIVNKKIRILKEDKKADPEVVLRLENLLIDVDNKKALAMSSCMRIRAMNTIPFASFTDEQFDYVAQHKQNLEHNRSLIKANAVKK